MYGIGEWLPRKPFITTSLLLTSFPLVLLPLTATETEEKKKTEVKMAGEKKVQLSPAFENLLCWSDGEVFVLCNTVLYCLGFILMHTALIMQYLRLEEREEFLSNNSAIRLPWYFHRLKNCFHQFQLGVSVSFLCWAKKSCFSFFVSPFLLAMSWENNWEKWLYGILFGEIPVGRIAIK